MNPYASMELMDVLRMPEKDCDLNQKLRHNKIVFRHFMEHPADKFESTRMSYKPNGRINRL